MPPALSSAGRGGGNAAAAEVLVLQVSALPTAQWMRKKTCIPLNRWCHFVAATMSTDDLQDLQLRMAGEAERAQSFGGEHAGVQPEVDQGQCAPAGVSAPPPRHTNPCGTCFWELFWKVVVLRI